MAERKSRGLETTMKAARSRGARFAMAAAALAVAACLALGGGVAWADDAQTASANVVTYLKDAEALSVSGEGGESGAAGEDDVVVALAINADGLGEGSITYCVLYEDEGWTDWAENGELIGALCGTTAMKALKVQLSGEAAETYDVWYRVWVNGYGWTGWAKNGNPAGSYSEGAFIEAVQVVVLAKDVEGPGSTTPAVITSAALVVDPGEADDLTGSWAQTGFEDSDTYLVGVVEGEAITVYWRSLDEDGEETFTLYWSGTYEAAEKGGAYSWESLDAEALAAAAEAEAATEEADADESETEEEGESDGESQVDVEAEAEAEADDDVVDAIPSTTFTYKDGVLSFEATALSVTGTVTMEQTEIDVPAAIAAAEERIAAAEAAEAEAAAQAEAEAAAQAEAEAAETESADDTIQALIEALTEALAEAEASAEAAAQAQADAEAAAAEAAAAANDEDQTSSDDGDDSTAGEDSSQAEDTTADADADNVADDTTSENDTTDEPTGEEATETDAADDAADNTDDAEEESADAATALAEPVVVVATDDLNITLTSLNAQGDDGYEIGVTIVNASADTTYAVEAADACAADGVLCDAVLSVAVAPGETLETVLVIADAEELAETGVAFTDLLVALVAYDAENGSADEPAVEASAHVYPDGEENAVAFLREALATDYVLIDNDEMTVTIVGYSIELYVVNKTDAAVTLATDEETVEDAVFNAAWSTTVPAGLSSFETLTRYLASIEEAAAEDGADDTEDASPEMSLEIDAVVATDDEDKSEGETIAIEFTLKTSN